MFITKFAGKLARFIHQRRADFVIMADGKVGSFNAQLLNGEKFSVLTDEILEKAKNEKLLSEIKCNTFRSLISRGGSSLAILDANNKLLAWTLVSTSLPVGSYGGISIRPLPGFAYIHDTFVTPDARRRKLGAILNKTLMDTLGCDHTLFCLVRADNYPALRNWEICGSRQVAKIFEFRFFRGSWRQKTTMLAESSIADKIMSQIKFHK